MVFSYFFFFFVNVAVQQVDLRCNEKAQERLRFESFVVCASLIYIRTYIRTYEHVRSRFEFEWDPINFANVINLEKRKKGKGNGRRKEINKLEITSSSDVRRETEYIGLRLRLFIDIGQAKYWISVVNVSWYKIQVKLYLCELLDSLRLE